MRIQAALLSLLAASQTLACAGLSSRGPAREGDMAQMRKALEEDFRQGRLDGDSVHDLAQIVAEREVEVAKGPQALQRVQQVRMCARALEDVLEDRAEQRDEASAAAAMALLLVGLGEPDDWREYVHATEPGWRAVATRTLHACGDGAKRRAAMRDPDEQVRLAAVRAAEDASDRADVPALLEAARVDPKPLVRVTAVRALGGLPSNDVVLRLRDLWAAASAPVRQAIVATWSFPGMVEAGGQRELVWVAETEQGTPSIIAGGILMRLGPATRGAGLAALRKGMQTAPSRDRALAIAMAPLDPPGFRDLVKKSAQELDPQVRVAALARLARDPAERKSALDALRALASADQPGADRARVALARAGDVRVTPLLLQDGKSQVPARRRQAATALLALGDVARVAFFLADRDVNVRTQTACEILAASPRW